MIIKKILSKLTRNKDIMVDVILLTILTVILLSLLFHHLFENKYYYFSADIVEAFFPWWVYLNNSFHSLRFPLLNQYWFAGSMPFAAIESGVFYPVYIVVQPFFNASQNINVAYYYFLAVELAHYMLASILFYLLMKIGFKLERIPAIFGGLIYSGSGAFVGRFIHTHMIVTLSWIPLLYLFYILFIERKRLVYAFLSTIILVLIITASHPQLTYYIFILFLVSILYFCFFYAKEQNMKLFIVSIGIILFSLALSAPKILLTLELSQNIVRTTSETTIKNLYNSLHPIYYLTLLVPYLFGKHFVGYWGSDYPWGNWDNYIYIGILPVVFLVLSLNFSNKRLIYFCYLNLFLIFFFLLGKYFGPAAQIVSNMPFAEGTTMISKMANFLHFFLVVTATIGINIFYKGNYRKNWVLLVLSLGLLGYLLFIIVSPDLVNYLKYTNRPLPTADALSFISRNIVQARCIFIVSVFSILLMMLSKQKNIIYLLIAVYFLDMFLSAGDFNPIEASPGMPSKYFGSNGTINKIKDDSSIFRVNNLWPRNTNMIQNIESTYGYHTIETKSYREMMTYLRYDNKNIFNMANIKYLIDDKDLSKYSFVNMSPNLWENPDVLPRIYFVTKFDLAKDHDDMVKQLTSRNFNPADQVLLYQSEFSSKNWKSISNVADEEYKVIKYKVIKYSATDIDVNIEVPSSGFLVFSQFQYPGWFAIVDGDRKQLLSADISYYALPIELGNHKVSFKYESLPLIYGIWISSIAGLVVLGSLFIKKRHTFIK